MLNELIDNASPVIQGFVWSRRSQIYGSKFEYVGSGAKAFFQQAFAFAK